MNPWETNSSRIILENAWFKMYQDQVTTPAGKPGTYTYMENLPFVLIVGVTEKGWTMIRQYRYPLKQVVTEFPAGSIETNETSLMAAQREFREETGFVAVRWTELGLLLEATSTNCSRGTLFLAEGLTDTKQHNRTEEGIDAMLLTSPVDIERQIMSGDIADAKTIAAYFRAKQHIEKQMISYGSMQK
jgi:8-oxo-dGTP pyrophosphatase MutT (NUDIX family)